MTWTAYWYRWNFQYPSIFKLYPNSVYGLHYMKISIKKLSSFFMWKSLVIFFNNHPQKIELTFNFSWEIPIKNYLQFFKRNPCKIDSLFRKVVKFTKEIAIIFFSEKNHPENFPKFQPQNWQARYHFFKNSLQEGDFENSLKFLQLVPNLTPIRILLCTFLYLCCCYPRPPI